MEAGEDNGSAHDVPIRFMGVMHANGSTARRQVAGSVGLISKLRARVTAPRIYFRGFVA